MILFPTAVSFISSHRSWLGAWVFAVAVLAFVVQITLAEQRRGPSKPEH